MTTLEQIRHGLNHAWDSLAEGWQQLRHRAADALTRFTPRRQEGELETAEEQVAGRGTRWGLLAAEVSETDEAVTVRLEVPGMERDQFDVAVVDGRLLVVRGEKSVQREERNSRYHLMERAYGLFERAIPLPVEVSEEGARARYRRGVLQITLPKLTTSRPRRITVESH